VIDLPLLEPLFNILGRRRQTCGSPEK